MAKETIGEYLKRERELRQISLEEMVQGTKIALQRLKELENDKLEDMPAEIFVRGFIKSYAEFIGLNPEEVILRYEEELKALQEKEAAETGTVYNYAEMNPHSNAFGIIITMILIFAIAVLAYWFFLKSGISIPDLFSSEDKGAAFLKILPEKSHHGSVSEPLSYKVKNDMHGLSPSDHDVLTWGSTADHLNAEHRSETKNSRPGSSAGDGGGSVTQS